MMREGNSQSFIRKEIKNMRGNSFGQLLTVTTFGESHGEALGVILDGVPAGLDFSAANLQACLDKRRPGRLAGTSERQELDQFELLSGIFEGKTLGTPIGVIVRSHDARSKDYEFSKNENRVGHADLTTMMKFGIRDPRGGGRSSGRETVSRVIAGYFASLILPQIDIRIQSLQLGELKSVDQTKQQKQFGAYGFPTEGQNEEASHYLSELRSQGESVGCRLAVRVLNCPEALGEPVFDKLKADLAHALLSIGGCMSFSLGAGEDFASMRGSEIGQRHELFGGIEGGISTGQDLYMELTFKPTSTVGEKAKQGRHDACLAPRVFPVVEAMIRLVLADQYLRQQAFKVS